MSRDVNVSFPLVSLCVLSASTMTCIHDFDQWTVNVKEALYPYKHLNSILLLSSVVEFNRPAVVSAHHPWELFLAVQAVVNLCVPLPPLLCTKLLLKLQSIWFLPQSILISADTQLQERKTHRNDYCWFTVNQPQVERWRKLHRKICFAETSEELSETDRPETYRSS